MEGQHAFFSCYLAFVYSPSRTQLFKGILEGKLAFPPRGDFGFGYDPIFIPSGKTITFGQMSKLRKINMDHRYTAFKKLKRKIKIL